MADKAINTVEVFSRVLHEDSEAEVVSDLEQELREIGIKNAKVSSSQIYTLYGPELDDKQLETAASLVHHDVTQEALINQSIDSQQIWNFVLRVDFKPGVTDNAARVLKKDLELSGLEGIEPFTSNVFYISGKYDESDILIKEQLERVASNPLIHEITITSRKDFEEKGGFEKKIHPVILPPRPNMYMIDLANMPHQELCKTGKEGTLDTDLERNPRQERGGTLALAEDYMLAIKEYSLSEKNIAGRSSKKQLSLDELRELNEMWQGTLINVEIELLAQMWSEHCRHSLYNASIKENEKGIFDEFIKKPTKKVLEKKPHLGVSIFKDNAGVFKFNEKWNIAVKNETHNTPSALDPYGGSITGIVGVNRDPMGTGIGAELIGNSLYYYLSHRNDRRRYFKDQKLTQLLLNPKQIYNGVVKGVEHGGNQMGIPINLGMLIENERNAKPIVGVGSIGRIPPTINGKPSEQKHIDAGDRLYIVGGRAGVDGIHGATFSSEGLNANSPVTAVQIGDAYTQKKMFDALLELRDRGFIKYITDLGAGGVCCASLEMAEEVGGELGGLNIDLDKLKKKYPGMTATELLMNESQERMAIAVDGTNREEIEAILEKHEVEFSDIGEFSNSGRAEICANNENVVDLDMDFIHHGFPRRELHPAEYRLTDTEEMELRSGLENALDNIKNECTSEEEFIKFGFYEMLARPNLSSVAPFMDRMDSTVKGLSVQHCIQGRGRISTRAACTLPDINSPEGLIQSYGNTERQSYIDAEKMGTNAFLRSIGNNIAMGGRLDWMVATDQALWQSSDEPKYQQMLIEANRGMAKVIEGCKIPVISGKDTMYNQAAMFDENGNLVKRGVFPAIFMTTFAKIDNASNITTIDAKDEGDYVYVVGSKTKADMGGSEYYNWLSEKTGTEFNIGRVSSESVEDVFETFAKMNAACNEGLLNSSAYIEAGGLMTAIKNTAMAGEKGIEFDIDMLDKEEGMQLHEIMYGETEGRFLVTVSEANKARFEELFAGKYSPIGVVKGDEIKMKYGVREMFSEKVGTMLGIYHNMAGAEGGLVYG